MTIYFKNKINEGAFVLIGLKNFLLKFVNERNIDITFAGVS